MAETSRTAQLKKLASGLPGANQQVAQGLQEARKTQLQEQIRQAKGPGTTQQAQQMGAQQQQVAGQIQQRAAEQTQAQAAQVGQLGLQEQAAQQRAAGFEQQIALGQREQNIANKLAQLDTRLKNDLLDKQLQFQKDQAGNALFTERQLMDYAAQKAESQEEFQNYAQQAEQMYERKARILDKAHKELLQALERGYIVKNKPLDQEHKKQLLEAAKVAQEKRDRAVADYQNTKARNSAIGTLVGSGAGALIGGPAGAAVGGALGGALGGAV